jgi:hypothetical protein
MMEIEILKGTRREFMSEYPEEIKPRVFKIQTFSLIEVTNNSNNSL